jgi:hypothetical protein
LRELAFLSGSEEHPVINPTNPNRKPVIVPARKLPSVAKGIVDVPVPGVITREKYAIGLFTIEEALASITPKAVISRNRLMSAAGMVPLPNQFLLAAIFTSF